jgi:lipopolysaccharide transport system permease protein
MLACTGYLQRIWRLRYFWLSLVQKDLRARYKNSTLGIGWSLLRPLAMTAVLCVVFSTLLNIAVAEYAPFLLTGLTVWQFLCECINSGCGSFIQSAGYIRQRPVPLAIFPLRTVLGAGLHSLITLGVALLLTAAVRGLHSITPLIHLLPGMMMCILLGWALAILCGIAHVYFSDTQHLLEIFLQMIFYLTPVMYPMETLRDRHPALSVLHWNPIGHLLAILRAPIVNGTAPTLENYAIALGSTVLALGIAAICLRKLEQHLVFWI